jgi:hypothetical protein
MRELLPTGAAVWSSEREPVPAPTPTDTPAHLVDGAPMRLRAIVERLQSATSGSAELDALIEQALPSLPPFLAINARCGVRPASVAFWSSELSAAIGLLSADYNFSVGQRDGICWAWIQPNDNWQPGEFESRHDHPAGSGLAVAYTAALAFASATFMLGAACLEQATAPPPATPT